MSTGSGAADGVGPGLLEGAVVTPYRFTDRPQEVIAFFELIGMRTLLRQDDFAVLAGRSGRIAVHPSATARAGHDHTSLVLGVPDAVRAAQALQDAGLDATWWDESWGRQASVSGPVGVVTLDSEMEDPYGYDVVERPTEAAGGVDVVATVYTGDADAVAAYFATFGFRPGAGASPVWVPLRAGSRSGTIGLFPSVGDDSSPTAAGHVATEIGLETTEPLDTLAVRLRQAGHPARAVEDSGPRHLVASDPDGIDLEVYAVD
jgi:hypothetical protein